MGKAMRDSGQDCARAVLEVVPRVMGVIRAELRRQRPLGLSVPQYRALAYLAQHEGASLSEMAEFIGLTLPSMSKMVDGLVARDFVRRTEDPADRRRLALCLTPDGRAAYMSSWSAAQAYLAQAMSALAPEERATVRQAMDVLGTLLSSEDQSSVLGENREGIGIEK
jgi:DNA-binding MarR family transcriptional regulator